MSDFKTRIAEIQALRAEAYKGTHNDRYDILELCKAVDWLVARASSDIHDSIAMSEQAAVVSDTEPPAPATAEES